MRISELSVTQTDGTLTIKLRIPCLIHPPGTRSSRILLTCSCAPRLSWCLTATTRSRPHCSLKGSGSPSLSISASSSRLASHRSRQRRATSQRWRRTWLSRRTSLESVGRSSQERRSLCTARGGVRSGGTGVPEEGGD